MIHGSDQNVMSTAPHLIREDSTSSLNYMLHAVIADQSCSGTTKFGKLNGLEISVNSKPFPYGSAG